MIITSAQYLMSNDDFRLCPANEIKEFAFIGRSNVGKSSLINRLTNNKNLAKTSSTPGKTQKINHFIINNAWYLVDLPGYGFAKVPKSIRNDFATMISEYVLYRRNLVCLFVLVDSRIPPQKSDMEYIYWLGINEVPFSIVFTKIDKIGTSILNHNVDVYKQQLLRTWETLPPIFLTSAKDSRGKDELLSYIETML